HPHAWQLGAQTCLGDRLRITVASTSLQITTQALEIIDYSRHRQLRREARRHEIGNAHDAILGNQSRQHVSASGLLKQSKSQDSLPYAILSYPGWSAKSSAVCKLRPS